jgi:hypothetical protein
MVWVDGPVFVSIEWLDEINLTLDGIGCYKCNGRVEFPRMALDVSPGQIPRNFRPSGSFV